MNTLYIILSILLLSVVLGYFRNKRAKNKVVHVLEDKCTGCQRCVKRCRHKALVAVKDETGTHIILSEPDQCTACRDCIVVCKFNALELVDRKNSLAAL